MAHKLGFYLHSSQDQHGLWDLFQRIKPPVILIHMDTKNDDLLKQVREWRSPETFVVGRLYLPPEEQQRLLDHPDPAAAGRELAERLFNTDPSFVTKRFNDRLLVDAWMSLNECVPGPSWDDWPTKSAEEQATYRRRAANYDVLQVAFRRKLREFIPDVEAVAFNFGSGNFQTAVQYLEAFPQTLSEYIYLGFHEYGWPVLASHLMADKKKPVKTHATLYRTVMQGVRAKFGPRHKVIATEAGLARAHLHHGDAAGDVGWLNAVEPQSPEAYWESLRWYNEAMCQDPYVLGACLYEVGWQDDWKSFRHTGSYTDSQGQEQPIRIMDWIAERLT